MPIYNTETVLTLEELKKYNFAIVGKKKAVYIYLISLMFVAYVTLSLLLKNRIYPIIAVVVVPFVYYWAFLRKVKKNYKSLSKSGRFEQSIDFYEDYMQVNSKVGILRVEYENFDNILETKSNFYIMETDNSGVIIIKENCSDELIEFIKKLKLNIVK